jgi:hypothetical protein
MLWQYSIVLSIVGLAFAWLIRHYGVPAAANDILQALWRRRTPEPPTFNQVASMRSQHLQRQSSPICERCSATDCHQR